MIQTFTAASHRPEGLTSEEAAAYSRGYAAAAVRWVKKHGTPGLDGRPPVAGPARGLFLAELAARARQAEADRHPTCHRAGMAALKKWRDKYGTPKTTAPKRATRRRTLDACPSCGHDLTAA